MKNSMSMLAGLALIAMATAAFAEVKTTTVVSGLKNPCGVAIQPGTGTIFVADSGNKQIVKVVDGKAVPVITDFPEDIYGKGPKFAIGPLGMVFINKNTLVVGGGGYKDGSELLRVYNLPASGSIKADKMVKGFKLAATDDIKGEGNFYGLAINKAKNTILVTCNGDDTKGWVSKAVVKGGKVTSFERYLATKEAIELDAPVAVTYSPDGFIVVGQMGEVTVPEDGAITFYDEKKKMRGNYEVGLSDITALAYSPKGQLYATDFAWPGSKAGGLFLIIAKDKDGKQTATAKKVAALDKPTSMVFKGDDLYVTVIGGDKGGSLVKISGLK